MKRWKTTNIVILMSAALLVALQSMAMAQTPANSTGPGSAPAGRTVNGQPNRPETKKNTPVKDIVLTVPKGIRRRYGTSSVSDPASVTKINVAAPSGVTVKLEITKIVSDSDGNAGFDSSGLATKTVPGTGAPVQIDIFGIKESTKAEDLKITASDNTGGTTVLPSKEAKFIVFSKYDSKFTNPTTQHKDTTAACASCKAQPAFGQVGAPVADMVSNLHRHFPNDCDHKTIEGLDAGAPPGPEHCKHCLMYCLRCCAKLYTGVGNQDDYKERNTTTVQENHGIQLEDLWMIDIVKAQGGGTGPELERKMPAPDYEWVYNTLLSQKKFIGMTWMVGIGHAGIVCGVRKNDEDGTICAPDMRNWDPISATTDWRGCFHDAIYPKK